MSRLVSAISVYQLNQIAQVPQFKAVTLFQPLEIEAKNPSFSPSPARTRVIAIGSMLAVGTAASGAVVSAAVAFWAILGQSSSDRIEGMDEIEFGSGSGYISLDAIAVGLVVVAALAIFLWFVFRRGGR